MQLERIHKGSVRDREGSWEHVDLVGWEPLQHSESGSSMAWLKVPQGHSLYHEECGEERQYKWILYLIIKTIPWGHHCYCPISQMSVLQIPTKKENQGASLVIQCLRIHLPMQEAWIQSLVWEDSIHPRATKPMYHNYWSLWVLKPALCNKRSQNSKKPMYCNNRVVPAPCN